MFAVKHPGDNPRVFQGQPQSPWVNTSGHNCGCHHAPNTLSLLLFQPHAQLVSLVPLRALQQHPCFLMLSVKKPTGDSSAKLSPGGST